MGKTDVILSVDFGTSGVKGICIRRDGTRKEYKAAYPDAAAQDFYGALCALTHAVLRDFDAAEICAVGLTSQAGTYLLRQADGTDAIYPWNMSGGEEYVEKADHLLREEEYLAYTTTYPARASSYPVPRILQLQEQNAAQWQACEKFLQPKDAVYRALTGEYYTDRYTWRGLAELTKGTFEGALLERLGMKRELLPEIRSCFEAPGCVSRTAAEQTELREGTPVFLGCNDYFASLIGMGVHDTGDAFDITGTSEHVGCLMAEQQNPGLLMGGPYFDRFVRYGVTASSGRSIAWGGKFFPMTLESADEALAGNPPLFLPYVGGERAPIWDSNARGVFLGIDEHHGGAEMSYAIYEGVAFSLYHIWTLLQAAGDSPVRVCGGGAGNAELNRMKATLFARDLCILQENETTALGAAICAAAGLGWFSSIREASAQWCGVREIVHPDPALRPQLLERFSRYLKLIGAVQKFWTDAGKGQA